jgi:hypothetical protein
MLTRPTPDASQRGGAIVGYGAGRSKELIPGIARSEARSQYMTSLALLSALLREAYDQRSNAYSEVRWMIRQRPEGSFRRVAHARRLL